VDREDRLPGKMWWLCDLKPCLRVVSVAWAGRAYWHLPPADGYSSRASLILRQLSTASSSSLMCGSSLCSIATPMQKSK